MRILAVSNLFPPYVLGGNEIRLRQLLERLQKRHEIRVLTSAPPATLEVPEEDWIERRLLQSVAYPEPLGHRRLYLGREMAIGGVNYVTAQATLKVFQPDVVLMSDTKRTFLGPAHAAQTAGIPLVWDITDTSLACYRRRSSIRRIVPWSHLDGLSFEHAIAISRYIRDSLVAAGVLDGRATYLNQGVDLRRFSSKKLKLRKGPAHRLLYVGTLIHDKGLHVVIEGLGHLARYEPERDDGCQYSLTVCGDSGDEAYKQQLRALVHRLGLEERVHFRGHVTSDEAARLYRDHDAYVFSSIWPEPFATTPLEAMASGCPVIGTPVGGEGELFRHGENCLVYDPNDPRDLADKVRLLTNPHRRRQLAEHARAQALRDFRFEDYVDKFEDILDLAARVDSGERRARVQMSSASYRPLQATADALAHVLPLVGVKAEPPER